MDSIKRAKNYRKQRDEEITKKLKDFFKTLDRKEVEDRILEKVMRKYQPKIEKLSTLLTERLLTEVREKIKCEIEDLVKEVTFKVDQERIAEEVDSQLTDRLRVLVDGF